MGTRGVWGFRKNNKDVAIYSHYDSYPEGLGYGFTEFLKKNSSEKLSQLFDNIVEIDSSVPPTEDQKNYCTQMLWCNLSVSSRSQDDWYCLLRETQDPENWQFAVDHGKTVYVDNYIDFIKCSLMCEFAYIFDIDKCILEFYEGFQKQPQIGGRYGSEPDEGGYFPCRLVGFISKEYIDNSDVKHIVKLMNDYLEGEDHA